MLIVDFTCRLTQDTVAFKARDPTFRTLGLQVKHCCKQCADHTGPKSSFHSLCNFPFTAYNPLPAVKSHVCACIHTQSSQVFFSKVSRNRILVFGFHEELPIPTQRMNEFAIAFRPEHSRTSSKEVQCTRTKPTKSRNVVTRARLGISFKIPGCLQVHVHMRPFQTASTVAITSPPTVHIAKKSKILLSCELRASPYNPPEQPPINKPYFVYAQERTPCPEPP